jgi:predicted metal-dependent HD superfamily phosphohydrolase
MKQIQDLYKVWSELCNAYTQEADNIVSIYTEIVKSYGEPHRRYHSLEHVRDLISLIEGCNEVEDKPMLFFAAFFHDVIYKPGSSSNEKESAVVARAAMTQLGLPRQIIEETSHLILLTKTHGDADKIAVTPDMLLFLDIDLSILGAGPARYKQYAAQIREEFKKFPELLFNNGRRNFLRGQLKLPVIYRTKFFRDKFEQQARINIAGELNDLL